MKPSYKTFLRILSITIFLVFILIFNKTTPFSVNKIQYISDRTLCNKTEDYNHKNRSLKLSTAKAVMGSSFVLIQTNDEEITYLCHICDFPRNVYVTNKEFRLKLRAYTEKKINLTNIGSILVTHASPGRRIGCGLRPPERRSFSSLNFRWYNDVIFNSYNVHIFYKDNKHEKIAFRNATFKIVNSIWNGEAGMPFLYESEPQMGNFPIYPPRKITKIYINNESPKLRIQKDYTGNVAGYLFQIPSNTNSTKMKHDIYFTRINQLVISPVPNNIFRLPICVNSQTERLLENIYLFTYRF